jgi:hypothetical protein
MVIDKTSGCPVIVTVPPCVAARIVEIAKKAAISTVVAL